MASMTSHERIGCFLKRQPTDRLPVFEHFWGDTHRKWSGQGHIRPDESLEDHFGFDLRTCWCFNLVADLDFKEEVLDETDETKLVRNGNYASLRWHKLHASTPEHVDFLVKDRAGWEEHIRPRLLNTADDHRRINVEFYRKVRNQCREQDLFFCWSGVNVFECMHPVCGHEYMLMGMALDPDWVRDMCEVYAALVIRLQERLFAEEGTPDGIWYYEDMGFKGRPFMSPEMYKEILWPSHKKTFDYAHSKNLPVILHSCGYVEPLVPGLIEAGIDALQAIEVKAGMDLIALKRNYGDRIAFMGGLDVRPMVANDRAAIERELQAKVPIAAAGGGFCLHSDHSIPDQVEYDTYKFFIQRGLEIGPSR